MEQNAGETGENRLELSAVLTGREAVRFTPAGIEVFEGTFHHRSEVFEAGRPRRLEYDFQAVAFAEAAQRLNAEPLGRTLVVKGFLAPRSMRTRRLVVHITEYI